VDEEARAEALDTLERVGYVDDARYAAARAETLAGRGYGDEGILHLLEADGVDGETAAAAVAALEPERERALRLVARLGASPRTAAQLQRKGFSQDSLEAAVEAGFADDGPGA
jgi:SOS response regulatory protein OraA/RecX